MATSPESPTDADDALPEYDFRSLQGVVRGKYHSRYPASLRVVRLADDVASAFATDEAVNQALRDYLRLTAGEPPATPS